MELVKKFEPIFGEWYVESFIGAGSFGRVYKIRRDELGHSFYSALKYISLPADSSEIGQLRADGMDDGSISTYYADLAEDISAETRMMNKFRGNTNIVSFEDSRVIPKPSGIGYDIFIRMELLDTLTSKAVSAPLSAQEVAKLGRDICSALMICAKNNIIHRDIKPDNIFVSPNGDYKLGDFGIARQLEKTAAFMSKKGTYNYMAPEVYKGERYGVGCDIYSLGLVMYQLLNNGRLPFLPPAPEALTPTIRKQALIRRMKGDPIDAPRMADEALSAIVLKACAFDQNDRFSSAEEMYDALLHYSITIGKTSPVPEPKQSTYAPAPAPEPKQNTYTPAPAPEAKQNTYTPTPEPEPKQSTYMAVPATAPMQNTYMPTPAPEPKQNTYAPAPAPQNAPAASAASEISRLQNMIAYFSQKADKYSEYDKLFSNLPAAPHTSPALLIVGAILGGVGMLVAASGFAAALILSLVGGLLILLFFLKKKKDSGNYEKSFEVLDRTASELNEHYKAYGACPVEARYTNPSNLAAIRDMIASGKAANLAAAVNALEQQAIAQNGPVFARCNAAAAANKARNSALPVFYPESMFSTR